MMQPEHPLFTKEQDPEDQIHTISLMLQFIIDLVGDDRQELSLSPNGKDGFSHFLTFIQGSLFQIADATKGRTKNHAEP